VCVYARACARARCARTREREREEERERERERKGARDGISNGSQLRCPNYGNLSDHVGTLSFEDESVGGCYYVDERYIYKCTHTHTYVHTRMYVYTTHVIRRKACVRACYSRELCARYRLTLFFLWISYLLSLMVYTGHRFKRGFFNLLRLSRGKERERERERARRYT